MDDPGADMLCGWCGHRRDAHRPSCEWGFGEPDRCDCHKFDPYLYPGTETVMRMLADQARHSTLGNAGEDQ